MDAKTTIGEASVPQSTGLDMAPPKAPPLDPGILDVLVDASRMIAEFRRRLRDAGYPFREPIGVDAMIADLNTLCFPDVAKSKHKTR